MRALLVVNTFATTTSESVRDVISAALSNALDLTVVTTSCRDDATQIAKTAKNQNYELVIGLGGDGTINELANGLLADGPNLDGPVLAAVPGGNANVFARNMGLPNDAVEATARLLTSIENQNIKTIGVGKLESDSISRWFLFNAGFGLDAAVLAQMEDRRNSGKNASDATYAALALRELFTHTDRKHPALTVTDASGESYSNAFFALVVNIAPWTYLGERPLNPTPGARLETSLDVYAPTSLSLRAITKMARQIVSGSSNTKFQEIVSLHDQPQLTFKSDRPLWVQVDGDAVTQAQDFTARHIPNALRVLV